MAVVPFCCTLPFVVMVKAARHIYGVNSDNHRDCAADDHATVLQFCSCILL